MQFTSFDGEQISYKIWETENPRAVIQIMTGLAEMSAYYEEFAVFLNGAGYTVAEHDFRKHGSTRADYGEGNLFRNWARDGAKLCGILRDNYPGLPVILFAHSIGTTVSQIAVYERMETWDGIIFTGPSHPLRLPGLRDTLLKEAEEDIRKFGPDADNLKIYKEVFGQLNKPFASEKSAFAFITSDPEKWKWMAGLPYTNPPYSNRFFRDFIILQTDIGFHETLEATAREDAHSLAAAAEVAHRQAPAAEVTRGQAAADGAEVPAGANAENAAVNYIGNTHTLLDTPVLLLTGELDTTAVNGTYGNIQAKHLRDEGCTDVTSIVYPGLRHSILQEPGRMKVMQDIRSWLEKRYGCRQVNAIDAPTDCGGAQSGAVESGMLYLCATPIGNLGDITARVLETLRGVDLIAAEDTRNTLRLLNHFGIHKPLTSYHEYNKYDKADELIRKLKCGTSIALVTDAGTPAISDPGEVLVARCVEEGVPVTSLPGACALITALTLSGLSARRFCFEGFLPTDKKERRRILEDLKTQERTAILYEAPHHLRETLTQLYEAVGDRKITLCRELTKRYEEAMPMTLSSAISYYETRDPRGEYVLVMEGADRKALIEEHRRSFDNMTLEEHMSVYTDQGLTRKEAMKKVASDRGLSKRDVYKMLVEP